MHASCKGRAFFLPLANEFGLRGGQGRIFNSIFIGKREGTFPHLFASAEH